MVMKRYSLSHERYTSLLPSKWRLLNVLEFPSTRFPPIKSTIQKDSYLWDASCEVAEGNKKILFLNECHG